jgi:hypothetical protein
MTFLGTVQNGVIVLASGQTLPEGTVVHVAPQPTAPHQLAGDSANATIWESLIKLGREVESLPCDLPDDLALNHDHYLYGAPKRQ